MKYSFMSFSCPGLTLKDLLDTAKRFGYDGIEPRLASKHLHGIEPGIGADQARSIRELAESTGIKLACLATSCVYANPETTAANVELTRRCIDLAADVGAPCIRVFGGGIGTGLSRDEAIRHVAKALRSIAPHAGKRQVAICMETHDDWCDPRHVSAVMRSVRHPAVGVNWDIMHPVRAAKVMMGDAFAELQPWIRHVHVHDGVEAQNGLKLVPIGQGMIDHRQAMARLKAVQYDGFISGEWIDWSDPYDVHLPRELAALKALEHE
ncbi:MAG: sugar phosphate isomerase/epimerase [Lentisphaerae bacterium]|nr:sugar phosphate isomerase/epimerase [Lentisphaerota bacterium]